MLTFSKINSRFENCTSDSQNLKVVIYIQFLWLGYIWTRIPQKMHHCFSRGMLCMSTTLQTNVKFNMIYFTLLFLMSHIVRKKLRYDRCLMQRYNFANLAPIITLDSKNHFTLPHPNKQDASRGGAVCQCLVVCFSKFFFLYTFNVCFLFISDVSENCAATKKFFCKSKQN